MNLESLFFSKFSGPMPGLCENVYKIDKNHDDLVNFSFMTYFLLYSLISQSCRASEEEIKNEELEVIRTGMTSQWLH